MTNLYTAIKGVEDAIETVFNAEIAAGGALYGVTTINNGAELVPQPPTPMLWFYIGELKPSPAFNQREVWSGVIAVNALVRSDDPPSGKEAANQYASQARTVLLDSTKSTGPIGLTYVKNMQSDSFVPSGPMLNKGSLYAAVAVLKFDIWVTR